MPKRVTAFEFMLPARGPETPAYRWVYAALRTEILEGRLRPGVRLPSTRDLAAQYKLSRGTIVTAFEQLKAEGYVEGNIGSGSYVSKVLPDQLLQITGPNRPGLRDGRKPAAFRGDARPPQRNLSGIRSAFRYFSAAGAAPQSSLPLLRSSARPVPDDFVGTDRSPQV